MFLLSCAGAPQIDELAPYWSQTAPEDTSDAFVFRGVGSDEFPAAAKEAAHEDLINQVIVAMNLGDPSLWGDDGLQAVSAFRDKLRRTLRNSDGSGIDGVRVVNKDAWRGDGNRVIYAVEIQWDRDAFLEESQELLNAVGVASAAYRDLEKRAREAENDGFAYESALIWATAARVALGEGFPAGYQLALQQISKVLAGLEYQVVSGPEIAGVGLRPDRPVIFSISSSLRPVGNAEFLIRYPWLKRDGTPSIETARILTDAAGNLRFLPPEVRFAGAQIISIAPSAMPFLENLPEPYDSAVDAMVALVEQPAFEARYDAISRTRDISTGILVLETDLTGNPLDSGTTAKGLLDDLAAEGFRTNLMSLDPREMMSRSEKALLRDLKADARFSDAYGRVIFGIISLDGFEQDGNSYTVQVSGNLALADIERQVVIYRSQLSKTSRAADSQQAVTAAFRQLGRSFAREVIDLAP